MSKYEEVLNEFDDYNSYNINLALKEFIQWSNHYDLDLVQDINELKKIEILNLSQKKIKKLPDSIGYLTNLKELAIDNNNLTEIPNSIGNLVNLKKLTLHVNKLTVLPDTFLDLKKLEALSY